jgi:hypothetical protein
MTLALPQKMSIGTRHQQLDDDSSSWLAQFRVADRIADTIPQLDTSQFNLRRKPRSQFSLDSQDNLSLRVSLFYHFQRRGGVAQLKGLGNSGLHQARIN